MNHSSMRASSHQLEAALYIGPTPTLNSRHIKENESLPQIACYRGQSPSRRDSGLTASPLALQPDESRASWSTVQNTAGNNAYIGSAEDDPMFQDVQEEDELLQEDYLPVQPKTHATISSTHSGAEQEDELNEEEYPRPMAVEAHTETIPSADDESMAEDDKSSSSIHILPPDDEDSLMADESLHHDFLAPIQNVSEEDAGMGGLSDEKEEDETNLPSIGIVKTYSEPEILEYSEGFPGSANDEDEDFYALNLRPTSRKANIFIILSSDEEDDDYEGSDDDEGHDGNMAMAVLASTKAEEETRWHDDAVSSWFRPGSRLLPHQVTGRKWMRSRESEEHKRFGGILADDMGLGKTVQMLACIADDMEWTKSDRLSGKTLVIVPLAILDQWIHETERLTSLKVIKYHGAKRLVDSTVLSSYDIVVTTYDLVRADFKAHQMNILREYQEDYQSVLMSIHWRRIVLDEAHIIKNHRSDTAQACFALSLSAKFKWCLTGTPLQNNVSELYSFFAFLNVRPYNDFERFHREIVTPANRHMGTGTAIKRLRVVLDTVMLRRLKGLLLEGKPIVELPPKSVHLISCTFSPEERRLYDALSMTTEVTLDALLQDGKTGYMSVLTLLLRLRQACDHYALVPDPLKATLPGNHANSLNADLQCLDSAKTRKTVEILRQIKEESNGRDKTIIFSQFTSMLDLLEPILVREGMLYTRYDGSLTPKQREFVLDRIATHLDTRVILISFKAGSTGLNLIACNRVILVDTWWNPALEDQAFDRVHRYGQSKPVYIYKLKTDGTVEDRILELQEKKRELARAALIGSHKPATQMLEMQDLLGLFRRDSDCSGQE